MPFSQSSDSAQDFITLDDKWDLEKGRILIGGNQAIARVLIEQARLDRKLGIQSAGFVTGYRGSPLGTLDTTLWSIGDRLEEHDIRFVPGVNEDLAATAVRGSQQIDFVPGAKRSGVFAAWYGKGPGVDRSLDALKHGNFAGVHERGGVLAFYGDDHGGKSSSVAHHSEQAMASALIPSLYPAHVGEILQYGLLGYSLSRFSGSWIGIKCVNEVVEQSASVDIDIPSFSPFLPTPMATPSEGLYIRKGPFGPVREEQIVTDYRLPLVRHFVRANRVDQVVFRAPVPGLGLVVAGKTYGDTLSALSMLGLDGDRARAIGLSLYKIGCIWPLEPEGLMEFANGQAALFVIEEKKSFIELQAAEILFNRSVRPRLVGKRDEAGQPLLSEALQLEPAGIALAIVGRLEALGVADFALRNAAEAIRERLKAPPTGRPVAVRSPFFCSGCPHSRSTRIPEGSLSMTGIGCHTMVSFARPAEALLPTHMGGEGANWIGLAPFTETPHVFQNMGDGTYFHSGLLAIRAAVAAGVNITYKILYNDAVAMTGGQSVDGSITIVEMANQLRHEGVRTITIVSDDPDRHRATTGLPDGIRIVHRDEIDTVQRDLRREPGCTALIYEQTCAAEKRRRRKRGQYPDPQRRLYIAEAVCEGCGDCSTQSTCVSLVPVETEFGTKRQIDQSSCNKDFTCLNGFCPSFITVDGAEPRKGTRRLLDEHVGSLPDAPCLSLQQESFNLMIAGIGGTGVVTVGAILGMAAHIEGLAASLFDMTGLAQKNGAVYSHIRIASAPEMLHAQRLAKGEADLLLAFDLVAAMAEESTGTILSDRTRVIVNSDVSPTSAFQFDRDARVDREPLMDMLQRRVGNGAIFAVDASSLARTLFGDAIGANFFVIGVAAQLGLLPISAAAIEKAIRLNAVAVDFNLNAFAVGRHYVANRQAFDSQLPMKMSPPSDIHELTRRFANQLVEYQDSDYAARYLDRVARVKAAEEDLNTESLTVAVVRNYAKLLAYKDEYEVARLLTHPALQAELKARFKGKPRLSFNLAPPVLQRTASNGRPRKRRYSARLVTPVLRLLSRLRRLRGTPFDPFGYTKERRAERALVIEYEQTVDLVISRLNADNHNLAVALLALPDAIRGFGPVKEDAIERYRRDRREALRKFLENVPADLEL